MKILSVVGARPQFIKAAALSRVLRQDVQEVLVHTGQHYDDNMSAVFFRELGIPTPDYNLGVAGGSHAQMTARMLTALEHVMLQEKPDAVLLYGDTNSTLAGALAAVKLHMPVLHVEAGNRFGALTSPEEINRICTDHVSTLLFACVESALASLTSEGLGARAHLVGNPMYDAFCYYRALLSDEARPIVDFEGKALSLPKAYYYMTCHREENTQNGDALAQILSAVNALDAPCIYPLHPRNREQALALQAANGYENVWMIPAVGYLEAIALVVGARRVVTDSGGVQREAFFAGKPCVSVLDFVAWPETMVGGCNVLAKPDRADILEKLSQSVQRPANYEPFGDGHACEKICAIIRETL